jgi:lipid-binding SYLF domain-containing protein
MKAKILSYSRSRGAFAGLELKGAVVKQDRDGNRTLYGKEVAAKDLVIDGKEPIPRDAEPLIQILTKYAPVRQKKPL